MKILNAKLESVDKTGAETLVSSNPGCLMQLMYGKTKWNKSWDVIHISQFLNQSLKMADK